MVFSCLFGLWWSLSHRNSNVGQHVMIDDFAIGLLTIWLLGVLLFFFRAMNLYRLTLNNIVPGMTYAEVARLPNLFPTALLSRCARNRSSLSHRARPPISKGRHHKWRWLSSGCWLAGSQSSAIFPTDSSSLNSSGSSSRWQSPHDALYVRPPSSHRRIPEQPALATQAGPR